ncbi:MAG: MFS transporter, partial [Tissierellia bacterium]|nr:MFS transporter [Tissierellia bacterium]
MGKIKAKEFNRYRFAMFSVLLTIHIIVSFHRLAAGVVRNELMYAFGISNAGFANLSSTYFYVYMLMQIPSGILVDTFGPRWIIITGTFLAGIGSIVFGFANNIFWIFFGRLVVGLGVSVSFI